MENNTKDLITGVVLAGGRGRRMGGKDKGLILFKQRPLVAHTLDRFAPQVGTLLINANRSINEYRKYGYPIISDHSDDFRGPLAGIESGLAHSDTPYLAVVPCDSPKLPNDLVQRLWDALMHKNADLAVVDDGTRLHPVFCLMKIDLLPSLRQQLANNENKIDLWFDKINYTRCDFSDQPTAFDNINTPEDLSQ